jgi:hypothetical protein
MKESGVGETRLTPAWEAGGELRGRVHSVFERVVNVAFPLGEGFRLVALCESGLPLLPDSVVLPRGWLGEARPLPGEAALLSPGKLRLGRRSLSLVRAQEWDGFLAPLEGKPAARELMERESECANGFDALPPAVRAQAEAALTDETARRWLGLGGGLTPSFDDACVGVMALCRALGRPAPFELEDMSATTDVSARYLRLAREGYFGQPLWNLMRALFRGGVSKAVGELLAVGASSGADMLHGVAVALEFMGE